MISARGGINKAKDFVMTLWVDPENEYSLVYNYVSPSILGNRPEWIWEPPIYFHINYNRNKKYNKVIGSNKFFYVFNKSDDTFLGEINKCLHVALIEIYASESDPHFHSIDDIIIIKKILHNS